MQLARMLKTEFTRGLWISFRYPVESAASLAGIATIYLVVYWANLRVIEPGAGENPVLRSLIGYLMWYYLAIVVGSLSTSLQSEAEQGTLEQLLLLPAGLARVLACRLAALLIRATAEIALIFAVMMAVTGLRPVWRLAEALPIMVISLVGLAGFGYALAGLTVLYKRIGGLTGLFNLGMLILLGVFSSASPVMGVLGQVLPLVHGRQMLQAALEQTGPAPGVSWWTQLAILVVNSAAYLAAGVLLFRSAELRARRRGTLGHF